MQFKALNLNLKCFLGNTRNSFKNFVLHPNNGSNVSYRTSRIGLKHLFDLL